MSPTISKMHIRFENRKNAAQNACAKIRTGSAPMFKMKNIGNQIVPKLDNVIRLYFENVNVLPT